jgi:hypothetical protein
MVTLQYLFPIYEIHAELNLHLSLAGEVKEPQCLTN